MVNILYQEPLGSLVSFLPVGSRIACNGLVHVTSRGLSRRRSCSGEGAIKQFYKFSSFTFDSHRGFWIRACLLPGGGNPLPPRGYPWLKSFDSVTYDF